MKKYLPLTFAMLCATAFAAMTAGMSGMTASIVNNNLQVSFTADGLKAGTTTNYVATAKGSAIYGCMNKGENFPRGTNKRMVLEADVIGRKSYAAKGTTIPNAMVIVPAPIAKSISCPNGQTLVLSSVAFSNVMLKDTTNGVAVPVPGFFTMVARQFQ
jgi:hypothetical protein